MNNLSISNISFLGFNSNIKRQVYPTNKFPNGFRQSRTDEVVIDRMPACLSLPRDRAEFKKRFFDFSREIRPIINEAGMIQFYKYGGSYSAYDDDSEEISLDKVLKYSKLDESKYLSENLDRLFKKYGMISPNSQVKVTACNDNAKCNYGGGYLINISNAAEKSSDNLFLKIFFKDYRSHKYHGKIPEITRSVYLNHNMGKHKNFPTFYFGDYSHDSPYLLSEYISPNQQNKYRQYPHSLLGVKFDDHLKIAEFTHNIIGDYLIDAGKIIPQNSLAFDKTARSIAKKIYRTPEKQKFQLWQNLYSSKNTNKTQQDCLAGLIYGIKYLPIDKRKSCYRQVLNSPYVDNRAVLLALLSEPDLYDLISSNQDEKKKFLMDKKEKLEKQTFLTSAERDYIDSNLRHILNNN